MAQENTAPKPIHEKVEEERYSPRGIGIQNVQTKSAPANDNERQEVARSSSAQNFLPSVSKAVARRQSKKHMTPVGTARGVATKARAVTATIGIWSWGWFLYPLQVAFWAMSVAGLASEDISVVGYIFPGDELFAAFYVLTAVIGIVTLGMGIPIYTVSFVKAFKRHAAPAFALAVIGYLVPLINGLPWFVLWTYAVIHEAGRK